jgi:hypothetical protein
VISWLIIVLKGARSGLVKMKSADCTTGGGAVVVAGAAVRADEGALLLALLGAALPARELTPASGASTLLLVLSADWVRKNVPELGAAAVLCLREGRLPPAPGAETGARGESGGGCDGVSCSKKLPS